jgi:hypothetical protein
MTVEKRLNRLSRMESDRLQNLYLSISQRGTEIKIDHLKMATELEEA